MPNWCDNSVRLSHSDKSKVDALFAVLESEEREVFQHLRPRPESEKDNWYDWNVTNWGTKWEISVIDWNREDDNTIWIGFDTAWAPPISLYEYIYNLGWQVEGLYHEGGMAFCGIWKDGDDDYYEYESDDLESLEALPDDLQEFTGLIDYYHDQEAEREREAEEEAYEETVTEWYPVTTNPHYVGFYETKEANNWPFYKFAHWNGKKWTIDGKKPKDAIGFWRGLKEDPAVLTDENAADMLENMMKDAGYERV